MRQSSPLRIVLCLLLGASLIAPATASAYTKSDVNKHKAAAADARKRAAREQAKANALLAETRRLEDRIDALDQEIASLGSEIGTASQRRAKLDDEIELLRSDIASKQARIGELQAQFDTRSAALAARVDAQYRIGDWLYIEMLLGSQDISDFIMRTEFVARLIEDDENAADELEASRVDLEVATSELERTMETVETKRAEVKAQEQGLRQLQAVRDDRRDQEEAVQRQKADLLAETKKNVARLRAMALAEETESKRIANLLKKGASSGSGRYAGTLAWPTPGYSRISSPFGYRIHPILKVRKMHTGIDIAAPSGARIVASGSGKVIFAGYNGGYGNCIMIDHGDGLVTLYAHQKKLAAGKGEHVSAGETIGYVGSTGMSTGAHLHFEVRVNGNPRNPMSYL